jgi:uncharacterized membrane protein
MNNKAKLIVTSVVASSMLVVGAIPVLAATEQAAKPSFWDKIMLDLGFKKNLTPEKKAARVEEMKTRHTQKLNDRLDAAVAAGKLTTEQRTALQQKLEAIDQIKKENAGKTKQEKKEALKSARADLKQWANDNGVNLQDIMPKKPHGPGMGKMKPTQ